MTLVVESDAASGTSACNHYSGDLGVEGDSVRLSGMSGTEMACEPAVMDLERRYLDALVVVERAERSGDALSLSGRGRQLDFELDPPVEDAPLIDTPWLLESIVGQVPPGESIDLVDAALDGRRLRPWPCASRRTSRWGHTGRHHLRQSADGRAPGPPQRGPARVDREGKAR